MLLFIGFHYLSVVALCASYGVVWASVPYSYGLFYVVGGIVVTLYEYKHLTALGYTETVVECETLLFTSLFQYEVALLHCYWSDLHCTA